MAKETLSNWQDRHKSIAYWWSVGFGSGLIKPAPGTWGSLVGLGIGYLFLQLPMPTTILISAAIIVTIISIYAIGIIEKSTGVHDAPEIVIDEFAGQWLAMVPLAVNGITLSSLIASFILFRIFDIIKPWPIIWLDKKVSGGFGVMVDDLVAGIIAAVVLWGLQITLF